MTATNAREAVKGAMRDYPNYKWQLFQVSLGKFVVKGTEP